MKTPVRVLFPSACRLPGAASALRNVRRRLHAARRPDGIGCMRRAMLALALLAPLAVPAASFDARGVARFDVGYARCEAQFEPMKGHRDDAYLAAYRVRADDAARARLAGLRRSPAYRKAHRAALADAAKPAAAASSPLEHQCQALWAATQRARAAAR